MKTAKEINDLKQQWLADPCWDIETTEGFEKYKKDLLIFRLRKEIEWKDKIIKELNDFKDALRVFVGYRELSERISLIDNQ